MRPSVKRALGLSQLLEEQRPHFLRLLHDSPPDAGDASKAVEGLEKCGTVRDAGGAFERRVDRVRSHDFEVLDTTLEICVDLVPVWGLYTEERCPPCLDLAHHIQELLFNRSEVSSDFSAFLPPESRERCRTPVFR